MEDTQRQKAVILSSKDNVAIALFDIESGSPINIGDKSFTICEKIPKGHKFSIEKIAANSPIIKYGFPIASATKEIAIGYHVHSHNCHTNLGDSISSYEYLAPPPLEITASSESFAAYKRPDGNIGIRNEIWIIPTVGCVSSVSQKLAAYFNTMDLGNIDGVFAMSHQFGCSQLGDDLGQTRDIIASLACHPNNAGALIIGLGCENNRLSKLIETIPKEFHYKIRSFEAQKTQDEFETGKQLIQQLLENAKTLKREQVPLSELVIGVKCGGSDGLSGLTANPIIGRISKKLSDIGAKVIMTEVPEMFGAEHILYENCATKKVFEKLEMLIENFKQYFIQHGQKIYENPSPGNKDGGITTLEEKSIGAVQKGGGAIIHDVLGYAQRATKSGLSVLNAPGNDAISSTALAASGAHIILFSTGRGTPLGFSVPTLKISSNSELAQNKPHWIDFDAGAVLIDNDYEKVATGLLEKIIKTANGEKALNEVNDIREFAIWKNGVTL